MKKILLFDDQRSRSERLQSEFWAPDSGRSFEIVHENPVKNWNFIWDFDGIIMHRSHFRNLQRDKIAEKASSLGKFLVFFSGNYATVELSNDGRQITNIYDRHLYQNLPVFEKYMEKEGDIELRIIAFGAKYKLEEALRLQKRLLRPLFFLSENESLTQELLKGPYLEGLKKLQVLARNHLGINEGEATLINADTLDGLSVSELREFISRQIDQVQQAQLQI